MKKQLPLIFISYCSLFLLTLISCKKDDDQCQGVNLEYDTKVVGFSRSNYEAIYSPSAPKKLELDTIKNNSAPYQKYAIVIKPITEIFLINNQEDDFFNPLKPYDVCETYNPFKEKIDSIVIKSDKHFNDNYRSGTNLTGLFDVVILDEDKGINNDKSDLNEFLSTYPNVPDSMTLILKEKPSETTDFQFKVKIYYNGVRQNFYEFITDEITILPLD